MPTTAVTPFVSRGLGSPQYKKIPWTPRKQAWDQERNAFVTQLSYIISKQCLQSLPQPLSPQLRIDSRINSTFPCSSCPFQFKESFYKNLRATFQGKKAVSGVLVNLEKYCACYYLTEINGSPSLPCVGGILSGHIAALTPVVTAIYQLSYLLKTVSDKLLLRSSAEPSL